MYTRRQMDIISVAPQTLAVQRMFALSNLEGLGVGSASARRTFLAWRYERATSTVALSLFGMMPVLPRCIAKGNTLPEKCAHMSCTGHATS